MKYFLANFKLKKNFRARFICIKKQMPSTISSRFQKAKAKAAPKRKRSVAPTTLAQVHRMSTAVAAAIVGKGAELKVIDKPLALAAVPKTDTATSASSCCNEIAQGTGMNQRVGTKCLMKNLTMRLHLQCQTSANTLTTYPNALRMLCIWMNDGGSMPALNEFVSTIDYQVPTAAIANRFAGKNLLSTKDFRILVDDTIVNTPQYVTTAAGNGVLSKNFICID